MSVFKYLLWPLSMLYGAVVRLRNYLYDTSFFGSASFNIPIIAIGNLSTGGTGKTMAVSYLIALLSQQYPIGVLSRGYGRRTSGYRNVTVGDSYHDVGDEPKLLSLKYPYVPIAVLEQRILGIPSMYGQFPFLSAIVLDDAFQHRSVKPHISILLTNYDTPYWEDSLLPMGNLREQSKGAARANIIIINKCPSNITRTMMEKIVQRIQPNSSQKIFFSGLQYGNAYNIRQVEDTLVIDKNTAILLITGIAEPLSLVRHLQQNSENLYWQRYSDHHKFTKDEIDHLIQYYRAITLKNKYIITTEKDAVRLSEHLSNFVAENIKIFAIPVQMKFIPYKEDFDQFIKDYFAYYYPEPLEEEDYEDITTSTSE